MLDWFDLKHVDTEKIKVVFEDFSFTFCYLLRVIIVTCRYSPQVKVLVHATFPCSGDQLTMPSEHICIQSNKIHIVF